jgi:uncharacterized phage protein (TIGR01671 family)
MREMKFRAWNKETKKMIYFDFTNIYGYEGETCGVILPDEQTELNFNSGYGKDGINENLEIMQYTGLHDKKEEEIFEFDILEKDNELYFIVYCRGAFRLIGIMWARKEHWGDMERIANHNETDYSGSVLSFYKNYSNSFRNNSRQYTKVGNIFDNSELLKESE